MPKRILNKIEECEDARHLWKNILHIYELHIHENPKEKEEEENKLM